MTFLFRKSSGEVLGVSVDPNAYLGIDSTIFGTITNPTTPNGSDLAVPKIWDLTNLRNATGGEITGFPGFATTDAVTQTRNAAIARLQTDVVFRKILRAIIGQTVVQLNVLRTNAAIGLSAITEAQAETAIVNSIIAGTFD